MTKDTPTAPNAASTNDTPEPELRRVKMELEGHSFELRSSDGPDGLPVLELLALDDAPPELLVALTQAVAQALSQEWDALIAEELGQDWDRSARERFGL